MKPDSDYHFSAPHNKPRRGDRAHAPRRAFSLLEFVGVLAVISILAVMVLPVVVRRLDLAALSSESASLSAMADALKQYIVQSNSIPDPTQWHTAIGSQLGLATGDVTTTRRNYSRAFLFDTNGWLGTALASGSWTQSAAGTVIPPSGARVMLVSTIGRALPVTSGRLGAAAFNDIWNTAPGARPSTWTAWDGKGEDLLIQRMNLDPLFHHVILLNGSIGGQGYFSIAGSTPAAVPLGGAGTNSYYLDGSVLGLYGTNVSLMAQEIIRSDLSRVFEYGLWRDQIYGGTTNGTISGLSSLAAMFYTKTPPGGWAGNQNKWGGTPQALFGLLNSYMNSYVTWAEMQPCFSYVGYGSVDGGKFPPFEEINNALGEFAKGADIVP